jgi:hypothetical protein
MSHIQNAPHKVQRLGLRPCNGRRPGPPRLGPLVAALGGALVVFQEASALRMEVEHKPVQARQAGTESFASRFLNKIEDLEDWAPDKTASDNMKGSDETGSDDTESITQDDMELIKPHPLTLGLTEKVENWWQHQAGLENQIQKTEDEIHSDTKAQRLGIQQCYPNFLYLYWHLHRWVKNTIENLFTELRSQH